MRYKSQHTESKATGTLTVTLAAFAALLAGCDGILDVEVPGQITEDAFYQPAQAAVLVSSAIADVECGYSDFIATNAGGYEDVFIRIIGWWPGAHEYAVSTSTNECNTSDTSYGWWTPMQKGRYQAEVAYENISGWDVPDKEKLLAQASIYAGVAYNLFGDYFCEMAFDQGELMTSDQTLAEAERWLTQALSHISAAGGDFALPAGIAPSAEQMAQLVRARVRYSRGDMQGAAADAAAVSVGFKAYATRDGGGVRQRWNKIVNGHNDAVWNSVMGPIDWWTGPGDWPAVIPYTGYRDLGVLPDGRAITDDRYPITTATSATAVADPRVPVVDMEQVVTGFPRWQQRKYATLADDIPLANWEEAWLMLAEIEGGQAAIDRVNDIRREHDLPLVTYLSPGDTEGILEMIIEERRRSLFLEGRFWATKLRHDLWFPLGVGSTPYPFAYAGGVRMIMPDNEFELNPNFDETVRGTGCGGQAPIL